MIRDVVRLQAALGRAELAWLVERVRRRVEQRRRLTGVVTLQSPSDAQRDAVGGLLGRPPSRGGALSVRLADIDALLRQAEICDGLAEAVEALVGPIRDLRGEETERSLRWSAVFDDATRRIGDRPELHAWLAEIRGDGLLRRLSGDSVGKARALLGHALAVLLRVPAEGVPLAELAAAATGDSHALDAGAPLATLALRAAARTGGPGEGEGAEARRDAWARVGVLCDELSAPVLVFNLRGDDTSLTGRALDLHATAGEPYRISLRQLLRERPDFGGGRAGSSVRLCENATVVAAAAARLGPRCAPLVCVEGQPKTAAHVLLRSLRAAGVRVLYHGDFDWGGVRIGNVLVARHAVLPWRFGAVDYQAAAGRGRPLRGTSSAASWDADLAPAMEAAGRAIHEEQVLGPLIEDLERPAE